MKKKLTKAESLKFLNRYSDNKFIIPKFLYISLNNFLRNKNNFIKIIQKKFKKKKIIIRSSALDEDTLNKGLDRLETAIDKLFEDKKTKLSQEF